MDALAVPPDVVDTLTRRGMLLGQPPGPTLAEVLRARVPLTDGEAATVAIPLAEALDELHAAGLGYGPPTARDVAFAAGGRPALVVPRTWTTTPDHDVPGLLRLVLGAMAPALPAEDGDAGLDEEPDLRPVLGALLTAGCRSGAEVARACFDAVCPEPLRLPDAGALARAQVLGAEDASSSGGVSPALRRPGASRLPRRPAGTRAGGPDAGRGPRPTARRADRRRARRRRRMRIGLVAVALLVLVAALVTRPAPVRADGAPVWSEGAPVWSGATAAVDPVLDRDAPADAAAALTRRRAAVLEAGSAAGLEAVDLAGGPARVADEALLASLGGDRLVGLSVDVQAAEEVVAAGPDGARVAVTSAMSPYRRVGESGTVAVSGTPPRTVVLHLRWTDDGWRVWQVDQPEDPS